MHGVRVRENIGLQRKSETFNPKRELDNFNVLYVPMEK